MCEAMIVALPNYLRVKPAQLHCQLLHVGAQLCSKELAILSYVLSALVLRGLRSLFLIYENISSTGASLN